MGTEPKHKVIFLTPEEAAEPSKVELEDGDTPPGLILPNGDINWNCPCLGGMAVGPCGVEFREAFSCFHYSQAEMKGSDCIEKFAEMQKCMKEYPELFEEKKSPEEEPADITEGVDKDTPKDTSEDVPNNAPSEKVDASSEKADAPSEKVEAT